MLDNKTIEIMNTHIGSTEWMDGSNLFNIIEATKVVMDRKVTFKDNYKQAEINPDYGTALRGCVVSYLKSHLGNTDPVTNDLFVKPVLYLDNFINDLLKVEDTFKIYSCMISYEYMIETIKMLDDASVDIDSDAFREMIEPIMEGKETVPMDKDE